MWQRRKGGRGRLQKNQKIIQKRPFLDLRLYVSHQMISRAGRSTTPFLTPPFLIPPQGVTIDCTADDLSIQSTIQAIMKKKYKRMENFFWRALFRLRIQSFLF
jgi:hypothetical protein